MAKQVFITTILALTASMTLEFITGNRPDVFLCAMLALSINLVRA